MQLLGLWKTRRHLEMQISSYSPESRGGMMDDSGPTVGTTISIFQWMLLCIGRRCHPWPDSALPEAPQAQAAVALPVAALNPASAVTVAAAGGR
jgi:hypothetical protein